MFGPAGSMGFGGMRSDGAKPRVATCWCGLGIAADGAVGWLPKADSPKGSAGGVELVPAPCAEDNQNLNPKKHCLSSC